MLGAARPALAGATRQPSSCFAHARDVCWDTSGADRWCRWAHFGRISFRVADPAPRHEIILEVLSHEAPAVEPRRRFDAGDAGDCDVRLPLVAVWHGQGQAVHDRSRLHVARFPGRHVLEVPQDPWRARHLRPHQVSRQPSPFPPSLPPRVKLPKFTNASASGCKTL